MYFAYNRSIRTRDQKEVAKWEDYSYFLLSALRKLPPVKDTVYRGVPERLTEVSAQYSKTGNKVALTAAHPLFATFCTAPGLHTSPGLAFSQVCWIAITSTTLDSTTILKNFGSGGTYFKLHIQDGRDISSLSLLCHEREVIAMPNSTFQVTLSLSSEGAKELGDFAQLPPDVDIICMKQVETDPIVVEFSTDFSSTNVSDKGVLLGATFTCWVHCT